MKSILANPRIELTFVNNGDKVVETFNGGTFDLIFMNVSMPLMDSLTVTKLFRLREKQHRFNSTPIIGVSAHLLEDQRQKFSAVGMNADCRYAAPAESKKSGSLSRNLYARRTVGVFHTLSGHEPSYLTP